MNVKFFGTTQILILGLPIENPGKKCYLDVTPAESQKLYYREESGASSQRLWDV
jgi:hypothetical protein